MAQDLEKAESRLQNIQAVNPVLGALRTISLGNWQMAIKKRNNILRYTEQLLRLIPFIEPAIPVSKISKKSKISKQHKKHGTNSLVVGLGSERGLCGRYNNVLADYILTTLAEYSESEDTVTLGILGSRLTRSVLRGGGNPDWTDKLPVNNLPSYNLAISFVSEWLELYEKSEIEAVYIVYNKQVSAGRYEPDITRLLPPELPESQTNQHWPPYIVETDPVQLYMQIVLQWTGIQLHNLMLEAAITEHAARYQLMESATQNADKLVDELTISIQSDRRQQITRELQELAVGAGLVG